MLKHNHFSTLWRFEGPSLADFSEAPTVHSKQSDFPKPKVISFSKIIQLPVRRRECCKDEAILLHFLIMAFPAMLAVKDGESTRQLASIEF